ncbi:MAG: HipA domain-containing protein [Litoreibacter sp.]
MPRRRWVLAASDCPTQDQGAFLHAQILFWLLGATDGHAKNFSIALRPGGGFQMTPLYDILTAQKAVDDGQSNTIGCGSPCHSATTTTTV